MPSAVRATALEGRCDVIAAPERRTLDLHAIVTDRKDRFVTPCFPTGRHRAQAAESRSWQCLLGDVLDGWGITLRTGLLLILIFAGCCALILAVFGTGSAVMIGALVGLLYRSRNRGDTVAPVALNHENDTGA